MLDSVAKKGKMFTSKLNKICYNSWNLKKKNEEITHLLDRKIAIRSSAKPSSLLLLSLAEIEKRTNNTT